MKSLLNIAPIATHMFSLMMRWRFVQWAVYCSRLISRQRSAPNRCFERHQRFRMPADRGR
jgi:hypothetical protein